MFITISVLKTELGIKTVKHQEREQKHEKNLQGLQNTSRSVCAM